MSKSPIVGFISPPAWFDPAPAEFPAALTSSVRTQQAPLALPEFDYALSSIAARIMRNHGIHRVVVTHEHKVVGMLSAFDLLKLVEDHRYVAKNPPTPSKRKGNKRR